MKNKSLVLQRAGFIIFTIAILLGIFLVVASAWPDMEAKLYGFEDFTNAQLTTLSCPVLMTSNDQKQITIKLHNPNDKAIVRKVEAELSSKLAILNYAGIVEFQPGETKTVAWEIGKENIDLNHFIFASVRAYPSKNLLLVEATCGIMVLDLPFGGGPVLFYVILILAALSLSFGLWLWTRHSDLSEPGAVSQSGFMRFLTGVIIVGVVGSILGWWIIGLLSLVIMLLTWSVYLFPRRNTV
jgi:hypothetical protein